MHVSNVEIKLQVKKEIKVLGGGWMPKEHQLVDLWIERLRKRAKDRPTTLVACIASFKAMVDDDPQLHAQADLMFTTAAEKKRFTPLGQNSVRNFDEFIELLNQIMTMAPEAYEEVKTHEPAGLIGFPINALLNWPMATDAGYQFFANSLVNIQFKQILTYWSTFLQSKDSCYVLNLKPSLLDPQVQIVPWLGGVAKSQMVRAAQNALGQLQRHTPDAFEKIFKCNTLDPDYLGFTSWDDFFTRTFRDGVRPVGSPTDDNVIVNACESAPLQLVHNVKATDSFWLKGQPYSLNEILNYDDRAAQFVGGTVYQAFLSALSYHRWHSPVNGVVRTVRIVNGSYYLANRYQGFINPTDPDSSAPNNSQAFLSAVATRAIIFIEADNPSIGLMCVIPIGMAEVSSCQVTVQEGQRVKKGDQLGMFHFGGSTHCLLFRPGVTLEFNFYGETPSENAQNNICINTTLATVK